ncbi:hypothetical protein AWENTII_006003 [Aspergillus wentii]|nr:hypothetical protein MW887_000117 [Aspergillus wentii]
MANGNDSKPPKIATVAQSGSKGPSNGVYTGSDKKSKSNDRSYQMERFLSQGRTDEPWNAYTRLSRP